MKRRSVFLLVFMQLLAVAQSAHAQQAAAFPVKPVTLVVPYRGNGPAINDLLGGQVDALFDSPATMAHVASGKLKVLGHGYERPNPRLPNVPAISRAGIPALSQFMAGGWFGLFIPAATPEPLQQRIHNDIQSILETREVRDALARTGVDPRVMTRSEFSSYLQGELERWGPVIRSRNIRPD